MSHYIKCAKHANIPQLRVQACNLIVRINTLIANQDKSSTESLVRQFDKIADLFSDLMNSIWAVEDDSQADLETTVLINSFLENFHVKYVETDIYINKRSANYEQIKTYKIIL